MTNWYTYKLGELINVQNGYAFKSGELKESGIPVIKIKNIQPPNISLDEADSYPHEITAKLKQFIVKKKDILISMTGSHVSQISSAVGKVGRYGFDSPALLNQRVGKLFSTDINILNNDFLYYFISRPEIQFELATNAGGSANQANISPQHIKDLEIEIPDLPTQTRIAEILSALDDKIELNRRMNQTLEQMAQTLFRQYFFDGIDADNSGQISLLDFAHLMGGGTPKTSITGYWDGQIAWVSAKDVTPNDGSFIVETERKITELGLQKSSAKLILPYSTIITARGTVGKVCIASSKMTISQSNYALKAKIGNTDFVLFQIIQHQIEELQRNSYGTVFDTITTKTLRDIKLAVPAHNTVLELEEKLNPLYMKILSNLKESNSLAKTRDTLLPKLMSGEIDVMQAENAYEQVLS